MPNITGYGCQFEKDKVLQVCFDGAVSKMKRTQGIFMRG